MKLCACVMNNCENLREKNIKCVRLGRSLLDAYTRREYTRNIFCVKVFKTIPYIFIQRKKTVAIIVKKLTLLHVMNYDVYIQKWI